MQKVSADTPTTNWFQQISESTPKSRVSHVMSYDRDRQVTILFGGMNYFNGNLNDTLELVNNVWIKKYPTASPPSGGNYSMTYDSERHVTVMGGCGNALWTWDGINWTEHFPANYPDACGIVSFDSVRGVVVFFGTDNQTGNPQTWEWDGDNWSIRPSVNIPPARYGTGMAFDPVRRVTVLYGGSYSYTDTWEWDGTDWTQRSASGPPPRAFMSLIYDSMSNHIILFGGSDGSQYLNGTWFWDSILGIWIELTPIQSPDPRTTALVFDEVRGVGVLFGGANDNGLFKDTWEWTGQIQNWNKVITPSTPPLEAGGAMAYDSHLQEVLLFGGRWQTQTSRYLNETWIYNASGHWEQKYPVHSPTKRNNHNLSFDSARNITVLFGGGLENDQTANDTWEWDGTDWNERQPIVSPPGRNDYAMAYDGGRSVTILFGGRTGAALDDTWEWDGSNWNQLFPVNSPSARWGAQMVFDSNREKIVLYGGTPHASVQLNDTWEWDGTDWSFQSPVTSPSELESYGFAYDSDRGVSVLYGGWSGDPVQNTWEWDGSNWSQIETTNIPNARVIGSGMTYDSTRHAVILFGDGFDDTWEYKSILTNSIPIVSVDNSSVIKDEGQVANITGIYSDSNSGDNVAITSSIGTINKTGTNNGTWSWSYITTDGPDQSGNITVTANDGNGGITSAEFLLIVNNLPPGVGSISAPTIPVIVNTTINATANFTDPGTSDTHGAVWDWGDGATNGTITELNGSGSVSDTHTYTTAGVYAVKLTVSDDDNDFGESIYQYLVVYDLSAGYVTGAGSITSPLGAYTFNPLLTGKAIFGFVSRYQNGANVPTGNTQFRFITAQFTFQSTSYDWLVVGGPKAQYKGSGTINGNGDYGFILSSIDGAINGGGATDKFRIKIYDKITSVVIYDNQMNASDTSNPTTVIDSGQVMIHQ